LTGGRGRFDTQGIQYVLSRDPRDTWPYSGRGGSMLSTLGPLRSVVPGSRSVPGPGKGTPEKNPSPRQRLPCPECRFSDPPRLALERLEQLVTTFDKEAHRASSC